MAGVRGSFGDCPNLALIRELGLCPHILPYRTSGLPMSVAHLGVPQHEEPLKWAKFFVGSLAQPSKQALLTLSWTLGFASNMAPAFPTGAAEAPVETDEPGFEGDKPPTSWCKVASGNMDNMMVVWLAKCRL